MEMTISPWIIYLSGVCSALKVVLCFLCIGVLPVVILFYAISGQAEYRTEKEQEYANKIRWLVKLWVACLILIVLLPSGSVILQINTK